MGNHTSARGEIVRALSILTRRRASTADAAEKTAINDAIDVLNGQLQDLDHAELVQAAQIVAAAADALEKVVATAKLGAFETYIADIRSVIGALEHLHGATSASKTPPPSGAAHAQPTHAPKPRRASANTPPKPKRTS